MLLVFGGSIAIHNIISIQENAAKLVSEQRVTRHLIENLQDEQQTLSTVFYTLTGDPDTADADKMSKRLAQVDQRLLTMEKEAQPTGQPAGALGRASCRRRTRSDWKLTGY